METIAATDYPIAANAQNILSLVYGNFYDRIPEEMPSAKTKSNIKKKAQRKVIQPKEKNNIAENNFGVYPNPVQNYATIKYTVPIDCNTAEIKVYDMLGKILFSMPISQKGAGEIVFDTMLTGKGVFLFTFVIDGKTIDYKKVVVLRE